MNEQLPPQSVESQIRALDGLFASSNQGNEYVIHTGQAGREELLRAMQEYIATPASPTVLSVAGGIPQWTAGEASSYTILQTHGMYLHDADTKKAVPVKKSFFDRLTLTKDE